MLNKTGSEKVEGGMRAAGEKRIAQHAKNQRFSL